MSDSSDDNLSDLEQENEVEAGSGSEQDEEKVELKGILDDVEETEVSWKDLVSFNNFYFSEHMSNKFYFHRDSLMFCAKLARI